MQHGDDSTSVTASCIRGGGGKRGRRGDPSYSHERGALLGRARSEVERRACTREMHRLHLPRAPSPPLRGPSPSSRTNTRASHHAHVPRCICMPNSPPSSGTAAPRVRLPPLSSSRSRSLSLSSTSCLSAPSFSLPAALGGVVLRVRRASLLYRCYAPTTASGEPTGERVTATCTSRRLPLRFALSILRSPWTTSSADRGAESHARRAESRTRVSHS